jgi:lysophospholipase L1-like esterase
MDQHKVKARQIRIKDFGVDAVLKKVPDPAYLEVTNDSLSHDTFVLTTDANGFIIDPNFLDGADAPVFVFGDSVVESIFVQQGQRFCDHLTRRMASAGTPRQFLNGGYSGATSLILLNALINKVGYRKNAAVLLVLPSNDTLAMGFERGLWDYSSKRYSPILPVDGADCRQCPATQNLPQLEGVLRAFAAVARSFRLELMFATTPYMQRAFEDEPWFLARYSKTPGRYERLIDARRQSSEVMRRVAAETGVHLLDLEAEFNEPTHFYDDLHLNTVGSVAMAEMIYRQIGDRLAQAAVKA